MKNTTTLPALPLKAWESTKKTLHLYAQIVGKIRMELMPKQNHWWHVTLYVDTRGLTTGPIPFNRLYFTIHFDFVDHRLRVTTSNGSEESFSLEDGLSVASFHKNLYAILDKLDIDVNILPEPYDHESTIPFAKDDKHHHYNADYIERYWDVLLFVDHIFKIFGSDFCGKSCPVHLYWHSFDMAVTRFSGDRGPDMSEASRVEREAYSHEVISFGFWPGDQNLREPAFYSYTYPAPENLDKEPLKPETAKWIEQNGSPMALLMYEDVRTSNNPEQSLLDFLQSAYRAGASTAGWDMDEYKLKR